MSAQARSNQLSLPVWDSVSGRSLPVWATVRTAGIIEGERRLDSCSDMTMPHTTQQQKPSARAYPDPEARGLRTEKAARCRSLDGHQQGEDRGSAPGRQYPGRKQ